MARAETVGIGGNDNWLSISCFNLMVGWGAETGVGENSLPPLWTLKSISGLRIDISGLQDLRSSTLIVVLSSFFFMQRFSALSSDCWGELGFNELVDKSWGPLSSPDRLLGL